MSSVLQSPKDMPLEFFQDPDRPSSARMSDRKSGAFSGVRPLSFNISKGTPRVRIPPIDEEGKRPSSRKNILGIPKYFSGGGAGGFGRSDSSLAGDSSHLSRRRSSDRRSREHSTTGNSPGEMDSSEERGVDPSSRKLSLATKLFREGSRHFSTRVSFEDDTVPDALLRPQFNSVETSLHAIDTTGNTVYSSTRVLDSSTGGHITTAAQQRRAQAATSRTADGSGFGRWRRWAVYP